MSRDISVRNVQHDGFDFVPAVEAIAKDPSLIPDDVLEPKVNLDVGHIEWRKRQLEDKNLAAVIKSIESKKTLVVSECDGIEMKALVREQKRFELKNGVLYRKVQDDDDVCWQLVLPSLYRKDALKRYTRICSIHTLIMAWLNCE